MSGSSVSPSQWQMRQISALLDEMVEHWDTFILSDDGMQVML